MTDSKKDYQNINTTFRAKVQLYAKFEIDRDGDSNWEKIRNRFTDASKDSSAKINKYVIYVNENSFRLNHPGVREIVIEYYQIIQALVPANFPSMIFILARNLSRFIYLNFRFEKNEYATNLLDAIISTNSHILSETVEKKDDPAKSNFSMKISNQVQPKSMVDAGTSPKKKPIILHRPVRIFLAGGNFQSRTEYAEEENQHHNINKNARDGCSDKISFSEKSQSQRSRQLSSSDVRSIAVAERLEDHCQIEDSICFDENVHTYEKPLLPYIKTTTVPEIHAVNPTDMRKESSKSNPSEQNTIYASQMGGISKQRDKFRHDHSGSNFHPSIGENIGSSVSRRSNEWIEPVQLPESRNTRQVINGSQCKKCGGHRFNETGMYEEEQLAHINRTVTFGEKVQSNSRSDDSSPDSFLRIYRPEISRKQLGHHTTEKGENFAPNRRSNEVRVIKIR